MRGLMFVAAALLLAACDTDTEHSDLKAFMDEVDARPPGRIEPLPTMKTIEPFSYRASNMRSPFEPPVLVKRIERKSGPQVKPDFNRVKQYLEQYTIGQLAMVGTLAQEGSTFGLIQDADGGVHRVKQGDYLGTDHGKILSVADGGIELLEIVPDGTGGWVERARTVALLSGEA